MTVPTPVSAPFILPLHAIEMVATSVVCFYDQFLVFIFSIQAYQWDTSLGQGKSVDILTFRCSAFDQPHWPVLYEIPPHVKSELLYKLMVLVHIDDTCRIIPIEVLNDNMTKGKIRDQLAQGGSNPQKGFEELVQKEGRNLRRELQPVS
jgi:hypothetical protein